MIYREDGYLPEDADPADYVVGPESTGVFTIAKKADSESEWVVEPVRKGTEKAYITHEDGGDPVNTITIVVENRPPERKLSEGPSTLVEIPGTAATHHTILTANREDPKVYLDMYETTLVNVITAAGDGVGDYFSDPDNDVLTYEVSVSPSNVALVRDGSSCTSFPCKVWVDVLQKKAFNYIVTAVDDQGEKSNPLMIPAPRVVDPAGQDYNVGSSAPGGSIMVGDRRGVNHEVTFFNSKHVVGGKSALVSEPMQFAQKHLEKVAAYTAERPANLVGDVFTGATVEYGKRILSDLDTDVTAADGATHVYTVRVVKRAVGLPMTSGAVTDGTFTAGTASTGATLDFLVTGVSQGTVEIGYHIWYDRDGADAGKYGAMWHSAYYTLTVNVVPVE